MRAPAARHSGYGPALFLRIAPGLQSRRSIFAHVGVICGSRHRYRSSSQPEEYGLIFRLKVVSSTLPWLEGTSPRRKPVGIETRSYGTYETRRDLSRLWGIPGPARLLARRTAAHPDRLPPGQLGIEFRSAIRQLARGYSTDSPEKSPKPSPAPEDSRIQHSQKVLLDKLSSIPHIHRRPTKEELLAAATGFWSRLSVRFRWFSIKSTRPFNIDDISAFFSWILLGHFVWIVVGTTTFFSIAILLINTVFAQETLARWVGNLITRTSGVQVVFESAIVPNWKEGVISFNKVFVSRRPGRSISTVTKGSQSEAQARAEALPMCPDNGQVDGTSGVQFDLSIESVFVTLSFTKWFNAKGFLKSVEMSGIRGVVDRTSVRPTDIEGSPSTFKHEHHPGDFELDSFRVDDLLLTVLQPGNFRPFFVNVFFCDISQFRKQWLLYDLLSANAIHGSFDNSLFSIHPAQKPLVSGYDPETGVSEGVQNQKWNRLRIDGLAIDHLNYGNNGPFSWIREGVVDIVADVKFPPTSDGSIGQVMTQFYEQVEAKVNSHRKPEASVEREDGIEVDEEQLIDPDHSNDPTVSFDITMTFRDLQAAVPLFNKHISYIETAMIRPLVAYTNAHRDKINIKGTVVKCLNEFEGRWTAHECSLINDISAKAYEGFVHGLLEDYAARRRQMQQVGLWTLRLAAHAILTGLLGHT